MNPLRRMRQIASHPANRGRVLRQLATGVRAQIQNRVFSRAAIVPAGRSSRIRAERKFAGSMLVAYCNPPDLAETLIWQRYLRHGDLFVDVGSNVGFYSIIAAESGASVIAIDPSVDCIDAVRRNMGLNGYSVEAHELALGDQPGKVEFTTDHDTMNSLARSDDGTRDGAARTVMVDMAKLDDVIGERIVAGMKIDVEGAERLVLEGGPSVLERGVGLIQIEWNDQSMRLLGETREGIVALLTKFGYGIFRPDSSERLIGVDDYSYGADVFARREDLTSRRGL